MPIQKNPKTGEYRTSCKCGWKSPGSLDKSSAEYALSRHEEAQHGGKYGAKTSSTANSGNFMVVKMEKGKRQIVSRNLSGPAATEKARSLNVNSKKPGVKYHAETMSSKHYK